MVRCRRATLATTALVAVSATLPLARPFATPAFVIPLRSRQQQSWSLFSSTGGGSNEPPSGEGGPGGNGDDDGLDGFLTPKEESENLKKAREFMSESSLPISFDLDGVDDIDGSAASGKDIFGNDKKAASSSNNSSALTFGESTGKFFPNSPSEETMAKNPYLRVVSKLSPSDIISKFTATAHPRVQDAVRNTILGLIGSLPKMAFDTTTITTGQRLASLMFQLQMTGYMFKNAEYRLSLSQSLEEMNYVDRKRKGFLLSGSDQVDEDEDEALLKGKVRGKIKIRYGGNSSSTSSAPDSEEAEKEETPSPPSSSGLEMEVDAAAYMSELRSEVSRLREELDEKRQSNAEAVRKDLLLYIRTLPKQELQSLTNTMSSDVLVSMKGLVQAVLAGIGDDQIGPDTVTEQSGEAMAQLCMWQLAVGYNLRELEVREEMKKQLKANAVSVTENDRDNDGGFYSEGGVDFSDPNALQ